LAVVIKNMVKHGEISGGGGYKQHVVKHGETRADLGSQWNGRMDLSREKWKSAQERAIKCDVLNGGAHYQRIWRVNKGREGREVKMLFPLGNAFFRGEGQ
jgi:hypothetical protein